MDWKINFTSSVKKIFKKLDKTTQVQIDNYIQKRISQNPFQYGENLKGNLQGLRRYRVGDYRVLCEIHEETVTILVITIGHRSSVYN